MTQIIRYQVGNDLGRSSAQNKAKLIETSRRKKSIGSVGRYPG